MSRNWFDKIMMVLHFNDNNPMKDKVIPFCNSCPQIRPLIDLFRKVFKMQVNPETHMFIDEKVVSFKGKHNLK